MTEDAAGLSLSAAAEAVRAGRLSATQLTRACLDRIARPDYRINAYLAVGAEAALAQAAAADRAREADESLGPLHGVPLSHKDMHHDLAGRACRHDMTANVLRGRRKPTVFVTAAGRTMPPCHKRHLHRH